MKNSLLKTLIVATFATLAASCQSNTTELLNGKDLSNWNIFVQEKAGVETPEVFTYKDGILECSGNPFGYIYTKESYSDFELHVEWRWADGQGTNSGIFLFIQEPAKLWPNAVEMQLCKGSAGDFVLLGGSDLAEFKLKDGEERPAFPVVKRKNESNELPVGEWNSADIGCKDGKVSVVINGLLQNEGSEPIYKSGHIGLQSEGGPIQFRNVTIKTL